MCDPFEPGAGPKCLKASLLFGPLNKTVFVPLIFFLPVGALSAN